MRGTTRTAALSPELVSQAGSGVLLGGIAVSELWLEFSSVRLLHAFGTMLVAALGAALLLRGLLLARRGDSDSPPRRLAVRGSDTVTRARDLHGYETAQRAGRIQGSAAGLRRRTLHAKRAALPRGESAACGRDRRAIEAEEDAKEAIFISSGVGACPHVVAS